MRRSVSALLVPTSLVVALVVSGCSDDEPAGGPTSTPSSPSSPSSSGAPAPDGQTAAPATDQAYVDLASQAIAAIVDRDHTTYDADVQAAVPLLTDAFATTFTGTTDSVREAFVAARTTVSVDVLDAAVVSVGTAGAQVLVLLDETSRAGAGEPTTTAGAALVEVVPVDGTLRVDGLSNDLSLGVTTNDPVRSKVERAARDLVTPLLNVTSATFADAVEAADAFTTAPLTGRLDRAVSPVRTLLGATGGTLAGVAGSVAFQEVTETSATVLVAATVDLTRGTAEPVRRTVRMRLELVPVDGEWRTRAVSVYP